MPAPFFTTNAADYLRLEGVYITELSPPGGVQGVDVNTVGIFGPSVRGPVDTPVVITSESRFLEVFGGRDTGAGGPITGKNWLALQNKRFGTLVVVRAANSADVAASFTLDSVDGGSSAVARIDASSVGDWGNSLKFIVANATDGNADHWNLVVRLLGNDIVFENLDTSAGNDNLVEVIGDDIGRLINIEKLADGRPLNTADFTGDYLTALDADGFINLGETITGYVSVAGVSNPLTAADYTGPERAAEQVGDFGGVSVLFSTEDDEAVVQAINTKLITETINWSDRQAIIWSGDHDDTPSDAAAYQATLNRSDRIVHTYNSAYTQDPVTGMEVLTALPAWKASIYSQVDVDVNTGESDTIPLLRGITRLRRPSLRRGDLVQLRDAGISALARGPLGNQFVSAINTDLDGELRRITRRRSADFLQNSVGNRLVFYAKKRSTEMNRRLMRGDIISFSNALVQDRRVIEAFELIDANQTNTAASRAQGQEFIFWRVRLIGHAEFIILQTEIGTGVTVAV